MTCEGQPWLQWRMVAMVHMCTQRKQRRRRQLDMQGETESGTDSDLQLQVMAGFGCHACKL